MGQQHTLGKVATSVYTDKIDGFTKVVYHSTVVVKWDNVKIVLNSGGWRTLTTKTRMNQASSQFGLGFGVYQRAGKWFVDYKGEIIDFQDNMILER